MRPASGERKVLEIGYNRFFDLYELIVNKEFWDQSSTYRFSVIKDICAVYTELIKYKPFENVFNHASRPNFILVGKDLVLFLRNLLLHFPYFRDWQSVIFDKSIVTAFEPTGSIHRFLTREHPEDIKYRLWDANTRTMTYLEINLNTNYSIGKSIKLNDLLSEKDGVTFICVYMKNVLMTQVEYINSKSRE